jgi:hypothetical protein
VLRASFWGFRKFLEDVSALLGYDTASLCDGCPSFRDSVVVSPNVHSSVDIRPLKLRKIGCLETSGTNHSVTQCHIPE